MNETLRLILKYLGTCLVCLSLYQNGVTGQSLKSELFLTQDAIPGGGYDGPAEHSIRPAPEEGGGLFSSLANAMGRYQSVLRGNYPFDGILVKDYESRKPEDDEKMQGRSILGLGGKLKTAFLDPIKHLIPNVIGVAHHVVKNVITGVRKGIHASGGVNLGLGTSVNVSVSIPGAGEFTTKVIDCGRKMVMCGLSNIFNTQCYMHCIFSSHPLGNEIMGSVSSLMESLCMSAGTVFEDVYNFCNQNPLIFCLSSLSLLTRNIKKIRSVKHFFTLYRLVPGSLVKFSRFAIKSLPSLIIKNLNLPSCLELKPTLNALSAAVKTVLKGKSLADPSVNRGCKFIDQVDPIQQLVGAIFTKGTKVADIILSGYWTLKKFYALLINSKFLRHAVSAINHIMSMMTGCKCNLLSFVMTGEKSECHEMEVERIPPLKSVVPPDSGIHEVCGSTPVVTKDVVDDIFPPIFKMPKLTTTTAPTVQVTEEGPGGRSSIGGNGTSYDWVDTLLKNKDLEYDDDQTRK